MPLYEYECDACHHRFEVIQKMSDPLVEICPKCGSKVHKLHSAPAIQFKGSGFYITDYAKKEHVAAANADRAESGKSEKSEKSENAGKSDSSDKSSKTETSTKTEKSNAGSSSSGDSAPSSSSTAKDTTKNS
jgi:putative FmdB family regulatory protein